MSEALITRDDSKLAIAFTGQAEALKENALAVAALIGKVSNADENQQAVEAQASIKGVLADVDKAVDHLISQANDYKKRIWASRDSFKAELDGELVRIATLVGDFAALEQAKQRAAEKLRQQELTRLEREKAEAIAKAGSHDALDAIQEHFNNKAAEVCERVPTPQPTRAEGQIVKNDWEIVVTDIHLLYRHHPWCVKLEARLSDIKNLLRDGATVQGVTATPIVKSTVRLTKERATEV